AGFTLDDVEDAMGSAYEGAIRYEGTFNNIGFAVGAGYTHVEAERDLLAAVDVDDIEQWNVGLDMDIGAFGVGAVYTETENLLGVNNVDSDTWVVGADY